MKIVEFRAENVKRLRAVSIRPDGSVVQITGPNGAGKSSILDSIFYAFGGKNAHASEPIRRGEETAEVSIDLGEIVVTRRWTPANTYLTVARKDGSVFPKAQATLDSIVGDLTFDPLAFTRMAPKAQLEQLRGLVKLDIDLDAIDQEHAQTFATRTDVNRQAGSLRERVETLGKAVDDSDVELLDTASLLDQMQSAASHNMSIEREKQDRDSARAKIMATRDRVVTLKAEAEKLLLEAASLDSRANNLEDELNARGALAEPIDVAEVRAKLQAAEAENQRRLVQARARQQHDEALSQYKAVEAKAEALSARLDELQKTKSSAIASAKMPIEGLGFAAGGVTYNGLPFSQASSAEQIRVATAIGMAMNPKLRILLIKDGSLLDENSLAALTQMAEANDFQIWLERVDTSGQHGIVIEDGAVVGAEEHQPERKLELVGAGDR